MDQLGWEAARAIPVTTPMLYRPVSEALQQPEPAWDEPRTENWQGGGWGSERILLFSGMPTGVIPLVPPVFASHNPSPHHLQRPRSQNPALSMETTFSRCLGVDHRLRILPTRPHPPRLRRVSLSSWRRRGCLQ